MEQTLFLKGVALLATLVGLQQWLVQGVSLQDVIFIGLVTAFLVTLEEDYMRYKGRATHRNDKKDFAQSSNSTLTEIGTNAGEPVLWRVKLWGATA